MPTNKTFTKTFPVFYQGDTMNNFDEDSQILLNSPLTKTLEINIGTKTITNFYFKYNNLYFSYLVYFSKVIILFRIFLGVSLVRD